MGSVLIRLKALPSDVGINLKDVVETLKEKLPDGTKLRNTYEEPIAFGLVALILDIEGEDKEGVSDSIENSLKSTNLVGEVEFLGVSKISRPR